MIAALLRGLAIASCAALLAGCASSALRTAPFVYTATKDMPASAGVISGPSGEFEVYGR